MFIVYGTRKMKKVLAHTPQYTCPRCAGVTHYAVMRIISCFTLFWIPLIPYSFKYYMVCPICGVNTEVKAEEAKSYIPQKQ